MIEIKKVPKELSKTRLDKTSSILFVDFSRTQLKKWILDGRIRLNGEIAQPKDIDLFKRNRNSSKVKY